MIDTICLRIPKSEVQINDQLGRGPVNWDLQSKTEQYAKFVRNPTKAQIESGLYYPRLTGYNRKTGKGIEKTIKIEFSIPKLIFLNNLDEVSDGDFPLIINTLKFRLKDMGVSVSKGTLENAEVSAAHYSKNIELTNGYTASHIISEINKANIKKTFDFAKTRFANEGQSIYAHTTTHELAIYDKIADMAKGKKRAMDKDQTMQQFSIFDELKPQQLEIIRIEARIGQKRKLLQVFKSLGITSRPIFKEIFSAHIARLTISDYWNRIITDRSLGTFSPSCSPAELLIKLIQSDPKIKPKHAIYLVGLHSLSRDKVGTRGLRNTLGSIMNERTWYRIAKEIQDINNLASGGATRDWTIQIQQSIDEFTAYKHKTLYPQKEIGM